MKSIPVWIGMMTLLLVSCDKEQASEAASAESPKRQSLAERKAAKLKEVASRPPEAAPPAEVLPEPAAAAPPTAPLAPLAEAKPPAPSVEERDARRAEERQQQVARMTEQFNTRMMERDANGEGLLSKDEVAGPMQRGFERMDTNGDGSLDVTERETMVKEMTKRISEFSRGRGPGGSNGRRN